MRRFLPALAATLALFVLPALVAPALAADKYEIDALHTSVGFQASHLGLSLIQGRFNSVAGNFTIDSDAASSTFAMTIKADSVDSGNAKRDEHLRSPDFFNAKQFPTITFKSTKVKAVKEGLEVTGSFTMHGTTKPLTLVLKGGKKAEFPKGVHRTGYSAELTLKRSDFGMEKMLDAIGDEVKIAVSFEGVKQ